MISRCPDEGQHLFISIQHANPGLYRIESVRVAGAEGYAAASKGFFEQRQRFRQLPLHLQQPPQRADGLQRVGVRAP